MANHACATDLWHLFATAPACAPDRSTTTDACADACDVVHLLKTRSGHEFPRAAEVLAPASDSRCPDASYGSGASQIWTSALSDRARGFGGDECRVGYCATEATPNDAPERWPSPPWPQRRTSARLD